MAQLGLLRLVRGVLHMSGFVVFDAATGRPLQVVLNRAAPRAEGLATEQIAVSLGET